MSNRYPTCIPIQRTEDWWLPKFQEMKTYVEKEQRRTLLVGDSLAARWPKHLLWPEHQRPVSRYAIGGDRTQHILWRLNRLDFAKVTPDNIIIFAGANNVTAGPTPEAVSLGVQELIRELKNQCGGASLTVMAIPLRGSDFSYKREFIETTNALTAIAAKQLGAMFIDTNFAISLASSKKNPSFLFDDEVHYSEAGYIFISGFVSCYIKSV